MKPQTQKQRQQRNRAGVFSVIGIFAAGYLSTSFIIYEMNPGNWAIDVRGMVTFFAVLFSGCAVGMIAAAYED
jgi:hypothetical protein